MKKRILIAPLNWGLGHATRCIPIINALINNGYEPIIASDGNALSLLQKEFPKLLCLALPSYDVSYAKNEKYLKLKLLKNIPKLIKTINAEKKATQSIVENYGVSGIVSDNRFGVYCKKVPSVYITHQLKVLSGNTSWLSTKWHQFYIKKFDACWIPDVKNEPNLSGVLGRDERFNLPLTYLGLMSRFKKGNTKIVNDILVLLSGPEPQRSFLEDKLFKELLRFKGKVIFVRGVMEDKQTFSTQNNLSIYNFMTSDLLEKTINESALVISRSGYTTIMDLAKLDKKAFFIPTPGQFEQEYLAKRLDELKLVPYCTQENFSLEQLEKVSMYKGLSDVGLEPDYKKLFSLF